MNIQQQLEELRAEHRQCIDPEERYEIVREISIAEAQQFKEWTLQTLVEALDENRPSIIWTREAQYAAACTLAANAERGHRQFISISSTDY